MKSPSLLLSAVTTSRAILLAIAGLLLSAARIAPSQEKVIHSFNYAQGADPANELIIDSKGNLYGTTRAGGTHSRGEVFELVHESNGSRTFKILYDFGGILPNDKLDGDQPRAALIRDAQGNFYGTTYGGGKHGTVFELSESNGNWTEKVLYSFDGGSTDGMEPIGEVVRDAAGHLYGTTYLGGKYDGGTVFELTPKSTGEWTEKILYSFHPGAEGYWPQGRLTMDAKGHLYGATTFGGPNDGSGTIFELTKNGATWTKKTIYSPGTTGGPSFFYAGVILDAKGNLYGTSALGGQHQGQSCSCGTVFELTPGPNSTWKEKVLHSFSLAKTDGNEPYSGLTFDSKGNLYGTTQRGGAYGKGTVFELSPAAGGKWTEKLLASLGKNDADGSAPTAGVARDAAGNVFGTTTTGGGDNEGAVFEVVHPKTAAAPEDSSDDPGPQP
ncbi:MAG TPA: choice-of-anchor tandem repeat GloVer-containing protein [Terracidiphilus sp.]|nr:choice-of-anchor tandem repeat GloVer-containing protein [Terracidiphilus sp.]